VNNYILAQPLLKVVLRFFMLLSFVCEVPEKVRLFNGFCQLSVLLMDAIKILIP
jgi:hypothetical protein